jgi:predicted permease
VRDVMQSVLTTFRKEVVAARWRPGMPTQGRDRYLAARMVVRPASNGLSDLRTNFERPLWILSAVVGLVLLLACSNLANLMLARAAARGREMALRLSIGAGRGRLVQQMLVEAAAISIAAVIVGALFARITAPTIVTLLAPADAPAYLDLHFDWRVLGFVAALGVLATVAFGLVPALRASSTSPIDALKVAGGRSSTRIVLLRPLVAVQTAVGLAVLVVAGVLLLSFNRLVHVDAGFEADGVTLVSVELVNPDEAARGRDAALMLLDQVRAVPGVKAAGLSKWPIMSGAGWNGWVRIPGRPPDDTEVYFLEITQGFVDAMRMRLLAGRDLARGDVDAEGEGPVLVNETFARMYFPGVSPIGRRFSRPEGNRSGGGRDVPHEIVGLVADVKYNDLREAPPPMVYMPLRGPRPGDEMTLKSGALEVRSSLPDDAVAGAVRAATARVSPPMKVTNVTKQSTLVTNTLLRERLLALLSAFFALVSLALAGVGLYGVLSYSVVRQTREIGIRIALGATWRLIVQGLLGGIAVYLAIGLATGLGAGLWLARLLGTLLYDVRPGDAATILLPLGLLLLVTLPAALLPARRAATVDPVVALRDE